MSIKGGNFFEKHVEKLVLALVGLVCIWLLLTRVVISPNKVSYANRGFAPAQIDQFMHTQALEVERQLGRQPEEKEGYKPRLDAFLALLEGQTVKTGLTPSDVHAVVASIRPEAANYWIGSIDPGVTMPLPPTMSSGPGDDREYRVPQLNAVANVSVEHFRTAAYVPVAEVDLQNAYTESSAEVNDIDFVTVAAEFDVAALLDSFHKCFAADFIRPEWRDPCLAKPVFSAVELQRQQLLGNGVWSSWEAVPPTRISARKEMFEIIEDVEELPAGGLKVRMLKFDERQVMVELLQPDPYRIASAEEEWFPPSFHEKFLDYQRKAETYERDKARKAEKERREQEREEALKERAGGRYDEPMSGRYDYRSGGRGSLYAERGMDRYGAKDRYGPRDRGRSREPGLGRFPRDRGSLTSSKRKKPDQSVLEELYKQLDELLITDKTDMAKLDKPLTFWAHDDTVTPGQTYRYRIRLGAFNPIAGTPQIHAEDQQYKNKAILWSGWSEATERVHVPDRMYFFPQRIQEAAKRVTVKVYKYVLGYWYGQVFPVNQGELIGKEMPYEPEQASQADETKEDLAVPDTINFSTGAVLVDVALVNAWVGTGGKNLTQKRYHDMLYSLDGNGINRAPVGYENWSKKLQSMFGEIEIAQQKIRKPLRKFADSGLRTRYGTARIRKIRGTMGEDTEAGEGDEEYEEWLKMMGGGDL
jgi:hypothetical protein